MRNLVFFYSYKRLMLLLVLFFLFLSGCSTHICIDEFNFLTNLLPFLHTWYDYIHSFFHKDKKKCHLDTLKIICCGIEMEDVYHDQDVYFWRKKKNSEIYYKYYYTTYFCETCRSIKQIAK